MRDVMPFSIRYAETDMMGVVHHANYLLYFEDARTHFLQQAGLPYDQIEARGLMSPVVSVDVKYGRSLRYGDEPVIETWVSRVSPFKVSYSYVVYASEQDRKENARPACSGTSVHCLVDAETFKPVSMKAAASDLYELYRSNLEED